MYELLIEQLRTCSCTSTCETCPYGYEHCEDNLIKNAADAIEDLEGKHFMIKKTAEWLAGKVPKWIRFITRPLTEEEKEEHPEWACILDCKLPDDGQDILVSNGRWVTVDTFFSDDGCYLDSNGDLEGLWWMPLPEPPKEE